MNETYNLSAIGLAQVAETPFIMFTFCLFFRIMVVKKKINVVMPSTKS